MIDITQHINAVQRQVGTCVLETGEARTVTLSRSYDAAIGDVWDACTNPERIPRWFLPVSGDLRVGGRYQLQGNASGTIERCDPPKGFTTTWEYGGDVTWIEVRLTAGPEGGTWLELEHIARVGDERWLSSAQARLASAGTGDSWPWPSTCRRGTPCTRRRAWHGPRPGKASSSCRSAASGGAMQASRPGPSHPAHRPRRTGPRPPTRQLPLA